MYLEIFNIILLYTILYNAGNTYTNQDAFYFHVTRISNKG